MNLGPGLTLDELSEPFPYESLAPLDRPGAFLGTADQLSWRVHGYLILRGFIPHNIIDAYLDIRKPMGMAGHPGHTPYLNHPQLRDVALYPPLCGKMAELVGGPVGLHLNLTGGGTTDRAWHQDIYLNPAHVGTKYIASWVAIGDVTEDSGPFEYVPGSHNWPPMRYEKLMERLTPAERADPDWPRFTEGPIGDAYQRYIDETDSVPETFLASKGDVLLWHCCLVHRGSKARVPGTPRPALISHYTALTARDDMPVRVQHDGGGWYFIP